jgi:hypothetical protein
VFKDDFTVADATEMAWGSGGNLISLYFPEPVMVSGKRTSHGVTVTISRKLVPGKSAEFALDFAEVSPRQAQKVISVFRDIDRLRSAGQLREAIDLAKHARHETVKREEDIKRLDALIEDMEEEGEALVQEARRIYEDFRKSYHPELLGNLRIVVESIGAAFPGSEKDRESKRMLQDATEALTKQKSEQEQKIAAEMMEKGDKYRGQGLLGLAAVHYEYVRDTYPGTDWQKEAEAKLEQLEGQMRSEDRW